MLSLVLIAAAGSVEPQGVTADFAALQSMVLTLTDRFEGQNIRLASLEGQNTALTDRVASLEGQNTAPKQERQRAGRNLGDESEASGVTCAGALESAASGAGCACGWRVREARVLCAHRHIAVPAVQIHQFASDHTCGFSAGKVHKLLPNVEGVPNFRPSPAGAEGNVSLVVVTAPGVASPIQSHPAPLKVVHASRLGPCGARSSLLRTPRSGPQLTATP